MSKKSDVIRLEFILSMIETIRFVCKRHGGIRKTLFDLEGQNAVFMCLIQIGEKLKKIEDPAIKEKLPVKEASSVRNFIIHEYSGVNIEIIEEIIDSDIKELEKTIRMILEGKK